MTGSVQRISAKFSFAFEQALKEAWLHGMGASRLSQNMKPSAISMKMWKTEIFFFQGVENNYDFGENEELMLQSQF